MHYKHGKVNMITLSDRELYYKYTGDLNIPIGLLGMASQIVAMTQLKSRIRETKNLSTDADSSTDTTVGWTKNT